MLNKQCHQCTSELMLKPQKKSGFSALGITAQRWGVMQKVNISEKEMCILFHSHLSPSAFWLTLLIIIVIIFIIIPFSWTWMSIGRADHNFDHNTDIFHTNDQNHHRHLIFVQYGGEVHPCQCFHLGGQTCQWSTNLEKHSTWQWWWLWWCDQDREDHGMDDNNEYAGITHVIMMIKIKFLCLSHNQPPWFLASRRDGCHWWIFWYWCPWSCSWSCSCSWSWSWWRKWWWWPFSVSPH